MTSYRLGPTLFLPSSTVWQALHLLNTFSPLAASPAARAGPARAAAAAKVAIVRALLTRISLSGSVDLPGTAILFCALRAGGLKLGEAKAQKQPRRAWQLVQATNCRVGAPQRQAAGRPGPTQVLKPLDSPRISFI